MSKTIIIMLIGASLLAGAVPSMAQTVAPKEQEGALIAVLKSNAPQKEKADACRQLAIIGTKNAIAPLVALLGDEALSHMARYALEPIADPAVDEAFRAALGTLKGRPLVGVIGSIGVRRDAQAVEPLTQLLMHDQGPEVTSAAVRALGSIGTPAAAEALQTAVARAPAEAQLAVCEGLFRCAELLAAEDQRDKAMAIYDQLRELKAAHQVRGGAVRGAILTRQRRERTTLLRQYLQDKDYILFSAAVQTSLDMRGRGATRALTEALPDLPADNQILVIQALGHRADAAALPALFTAVRSGAVNVRLAALKALPQIGDAAAVPVLVELLDDSDGQISKTSMESLAAIQGQEADAAVMTMFKSSDRDRRLTALDLMGRRRMVTAVPTLLEAGGDADSRVRPEAIKKVGELGGPAQLPALLDRLAKLETPGDLDAARQALGDVCAKADNPESCTGKLAAAMSQAQSGQKIVLLRVLSSIGGSNALKAVRQAVDDRDAEVHAAAIRAMGIWKTADPAADLLALAKAADNANDKTLCLRAYLALAGRRDLPTNQRLSMCQQVAGLIQRDDEKKLLLGTLGSIDSPEALAQIAPYLNDAATCNEAGMASVRIADRLLKGRDAARVAARLIEPLEKVTQTATNTDLLGQAKALLEQAKSKAPR